MNGFGPRSAALAIVGDEILSGEVQDQNAPFLASRLWELGIKVERILVLPDALEELANELAELAARYDYVLVTGGLGPTHDDVTREAVARALDAPLEPHAAAREFLADDYGAAMTPAEEAMAELPAGSRVLRGRQRLAYGFRARNVFVFPGVPLLLQDIFEIAAEELLSAPFFKETLWVRGKEGDFSDALRRIQADHPGVGIGSYPVFVDGRYRCKLVLRARDHEALRAAAKAIEAAVEFDAPPEP